MALNVLATVVIPPHLKASGAVNAGIALSKSISALCDIDIAIMSTENRVESSGQLTCIYSKASPPFGALGKYLPNKIRSPLYRSSIPALIDSKKYDLVHIHNPLPTLEMQRIARRCVAQNIPYVVSTHGFVEVTSGGQAYGLNPIEKIAWNILVSQPLDYVVRHAALLFPTSPNDEDILRQMEVADDRMELITNGVDFAYFEPIPAQTINQVREKFSLGNDSRPVCFFLANHTANKGIHVLLDAFQQVELPFVGVIGGKRRDGVAYPSDEEGQDEFGRRFVITDRLSDEEVRALYALADVFVFPTLSDTLPLVILEAMASGLPVLSTSVGGIPFQVVDGCGILVSPNDSTAFANGLKELFSKNREELKQMGEQSKARVESMFDWNQSARLAVNAYKRVINEE